MPTLGPIKPSWDCKGGNLTIEQGDYDYSNGHCVIGGDDTMGGNRVTMVELQGVARHGRSMFLQRYIPVLLLYSKGRS